MSYKGFRVKKCKLVFVDATYCLLMCGGDGGSRINNL